ncbi:MAG: alpha/beta hydrolase [Crocinitomicaceae bacterium]
MKLNTKWIAHQSAKETIIFLHEGLGCIEMWKGYPEELCDKLGVNGLIYDRAGYGKSPGSLQDRTSDYLHLAAEELKDVIDYFGIQSPILYGHSDGGSIALIFAALYPDIPKMVITEAAHVFNEKETIAGVSAARPLMELGKMEGLKKYHGNRYQEVFYAWNDIWLDDSFKNWDITNLLPNINCPQLIIQGKDDPYGTLKQIKAIAELTAGNSHLLAPESCGHAPHKEQTEQLLKEVLNFIHEYS